MSNRPAYAQVAVGGVKALGGIYSDVAKMAPLHVLIDL